MSKCFSGVESIWRKPQNICNNLVVIYPTRVAWLVSEGIITSDKHYCGNTIFQSSIKQEWDNISKQTRNSNWCWEFLPHNYAEDYRRNKLPRYNGRVNAMPHISRTFTTRYIYHGAWTTCFLRFPVIYLYGKKISLIHWYNITDVRWHDLDFVREWINIEWQ
jgi:hypothetical protein